MEDVSAVTIGDEQESEDVSEHLTKKTENSANKSAKDDSTDVKLASMRCQDCGQQFTRWEAFKTHLRKHVLEEAMAEEEERRQGIKRFLEMNGSNGNVESAAPEKKQKNDDDGDDYEENSDVDVEGDEEDDEEFFDSSWQVRPSEIVTVRPRVAMLSEEEKPVFSSSHRVYACSICGKVYSYLESFRNHQKTHEKEEKKQPTENKCPDCGKVFARPSLLVTHLKVHRPPVPMEPSTLKCDQCVKNFNSLQTYLIHMDLHKQKPFWCLACAKGFRDELSLDKHLQGHNLRRHKCDLCEKSFRVPAELRYHYNTHTGAKPYKCTLCKKNFSQLGNLITHRKKHVGVYVGASKTPLGPRNHLFAGRRRVTEMKRLVFTGMGSTEEAEVIDMLQEHQEEEEEEEDIEVGEEESGSEESGSESSSEDSGAEGSGSSKSDSSDSSGSDSSDDSDSSGSGMEEKQQEGKEETALEAHVAVQQKRPKEWECFECGEGFDQESALHLHYMKHASGELPVQ